jgi:thiamine pyrophosphate-dependent acetolactate synthase large subunit-like protein
MTIAVTEATTAAAITVTTTAEITTMMTAAFTREAPRFVDLFVNNENGPFQGKHP